MTFDPMPERAQEPIKGPLYFFKAEITSALPKFKSDFARAMGHFREERYRYGYMTKTGKLAIAPQFGTAENFSEGLAVVGAVKRVETETSVKIYTPKGVINRKGELVIPTKFDKIGAFSNGLAKAKLPTPTFSTDREKSKIYEGYINPKGEFVIPFELGESMRAAGDFSEGLAWVHPMLPYAEAKAYMSDKDLEMLSKFYGQRKLKDDAMVRTDYTPYGYMDQTGKMVIPARFKSVTTFAEGRAAVRDSKSGKWGFIDIKGEWAIPAKYDYATPFSAGLAAVTQDRQCGYIDVKGQLKLPLKYKRCDSFSGDFAVVKNTAGEYHWLSREGKLKSLFKGESFGEVRSLGELHEGVLSVQVETPSGQRWCFINTEGEVILPPKYSGYHRPRFRDGIARVEITVKEPSTNVKAKGKIVEVKKTGYINLKGEWVIQPVNNY